MNPGERSDSLHLEDRAALSEAVRLAMPSYRLSWHANAEAMVWAELSSEGAPAWQPRFTICRLDGGLVMMIEAGAAARQFCSAGTMMEAVAVAGAISREAMMRPFPQPAARGPHPFACDAPALLQ